MYCTPICFLQLWLKYCKGIASLLTQKTKFWLTQSLNSESSVKWKTTNCNESDRATELTNQKTVWIWKSTHELNIQIWNSFDWQYQWKSHLRRCQMFKYVKNICNLIQPVRLKYSWGVHVKRFPKCRRMFERKALNWISMWNALWLKY